MIKLMIVESPAKAKKIASFLDGDWRVEACMGHVRDLPESELGINVEQGFVPSYGVLPGKGNLVRRLVKAMKDADTVYLATDPDREGEAIAWHLLELAHLANEKPVHRVTFSAITAEAVQHAITHPRSLDTHLVEAQQARRIVDRLVGYLASPLAVKALDGKFSAGRVQSVCLRLVVERERAIMAFQPQPFWTLTLKIEVDGVPFTATLAQVKGAELPFTNRTMADRLMTLLDGTQHWVAKAAQAVRERHPLPPFTTSTLQQAAAKTLGLSPDRTMALAQMLYEAGRITYMRTDGVTVAPEAQHAARSMIEHEYGVDYLPDTPPIYIAKAVNSQEVHEAIRPTDLTRLRGDTEGDGAALYALIWRRFIASQMRSARYQLTGAVIQSGKTFGQPFPLEFRTRGRTLIFDGFLKVYEEMIEDEEAEENAVLPPLRDGQLLISVSPAVTEGTTRAPARYTQAALIAALETHGVGRPSTYAGMVNTIQDKGYVRLDANRLVPTEAGMGLCDFLTTHFPDVLATAYTAQLETELDRIAAGERERRDLLNNFWTGFQPQLKGATEYALAQWRARHAPKPLALKPTKDGAHE